MRDGPRAVGARRRSLLRRLANCANLRHRAAKASAGSAVTHAVAAGNALARARDLCDDGEWARWVRRNFEASLRTAQRYVRLARHWPRVESDATRVSPASQAEATRAIRRALFDSERRQAIEAPDEPAAGAHATGDASLHSPFVAGTPTRPPRVASLAVAGLDRLAASLREASEPGDAAAEYIIGRIEALSGDIRLDVENEKPTTARPQFVYFAEAMGTDRVKVGIAEDPMARLASLQTACPHPLRLIGKVMGGRLLEASLHARLEPFRLGGEWFHLARSVRELIERLIAGDDSSAST